MRGVRERHAHQRVDDQLDTLTFEDRHHHDAVRVRHRADLVETETAIEPRGRRHVRHTQTHPETSSDHKASLTVPSSRG
jgi:hypothetical protein